MSRVNLIKIKEDYLNSYEKLTKRIIVCAGTGCVSSGSLKIFDAIKAKLDKEGQNATVELKPEETHDYLMSKSGCQGFCQQGPLVTILPDDIIYCKVKINDVDDIVEKTITNGEIIDRLLYNDHKTNTTAKGRHDINFYVKQSRTVLKQCGFSDAEDINEYIANDGYIAAQKAYLEYSDVAICEEILASGLRGRGGGGFPTGKKWEFTRIEPGPKKYVICNGDEGDPGAFMDRSVMEGNPHSVIEGMLIAAKAIGADEGYVYVRAEYPLAVERMNKAVKEAEKLGTLGKDVFGSGSNFTLHIMEGAGAFVCGEETALMQSIEGKRGMPNPKPPFPAQCGLFGKPTVINNVETLASVPLIIKDGAAKYREVGTVKSPGTKTFALTGHVVNTGLIEVPFGTTLRKIVFDIGGGVLDDNGNPTDEMFKAVQIGGPSGGCLTEEHLDIPMDFDSLKSVGAMVGSGGLVVMNKNSCMIQIAKFFMQFTQNESCGKCVLCREGTKQMLAMLTEITEGTATLETLDILEKTAKAVAKGSLCGLGKTAPNPVLSTLRYFRDEYEAHVIQKRCPTNQCKALMTPVITDKCKGCTLCAKKCPVGAISGKVKEKHVIDSEKCIKCGVCKEVCKFGAVTGV